MFIHSPPKTLCRVQELLLPSTTTLSSSLAEVGGHRGEVWRGVNGGLGGCYGSMLCKNLKFFVGYCIHNVGSGAPGEAVMGRACTHAPPLVRTSGLLGDIIALVESFLSDYVFKTCFP